MLERNLENFLSNLNSRKSGLLIHLSTDIDIDEMLQCKHISLIRSNDGYYSIVKESHSIDDFSKQSIAFDYHTDGLYLDKIPPLVFLYCRNPGSMNIKTTFIDSRDIAVKLLEMFSYDLLSIINVNYIGRGNIVFSKKLIEKHPLDGCICMHWGSRIYLSPELDSTKLADMPNIRQLSAIHSEIISAIDSYSAKEHQWRPGDFIAFDNLSFIHSRSSKNMDNERELVRFYVASSQDEA